MSNLQKNGSVEGVFEADGFPSEEESFIWGDSVPLFQNQSGLFRESSLGERRGEVFPPREYSAEKKRRERDGPGSLRT